MFIASWAVRVSQVSPAVRVGQTVRVNQSGLLW